MNVQVHLLDKVSAYNIVAEPAAGERVGAYDGDAVILVTGTGDVSIHFGGSDQDRTANIDAIVNALQKARLTVIKRWAASGAPSSRAEVVHERLLEGLPTFDILEDPEALVPALRELGFRVGPRIVAQAPDVDAPEHSDEDHRGPHSFVAGCPRCTWDVAFAIGEGDLEPLTAPHTHIDTHLTVALCLRCEAETAQAERWDHRRESQV